MVMFFSLTNTPATFQSMMNFIFRELINEGYITIYMDDILIHTPNDTALHRQVVHDVLRILADNDLYLKPQKCQFEATEVEYLGVIISEDCIAMDPIKVNGVKNWKRPTTLQELRAFLGFLNFYRMYIRNFSLLATPLNTLITFCAKGGKFHWEYEHASAFHALVDAVCTAPVLRQPRFEDLFVIDCDASAYTICYDLFPFLLIYFLFCLSLCAAPCLALFAFLCACFIAYLCVVLGHILHDT